jgi:hypothetical protein
VKQSKSVFSYCQAMHVIVIQDRASIKNTSQKGVLLTQSSFVDASDVSTEVEATIAIGAASRWVIVVVVDRTTAENPATLAGAANADKKAMPNNFILFVTEGEYVLNEPIR